jgi:hypothetical protein
MRLRHLGRLFLELCAYSVMNRVWWPVPLVLVLLGLGAVVIVGQSAAPFIYTLF